MINFGSKVTPILGSVVLVGVFSLPVAVQASDAGAFVGGMLAGKVIHNMQSRTEAEQQQAYYAQQQAQRPVAQAAPAPAAGQSAEQKLAELDKLAAGGYITPAEYKAKKQAVLDSM